MKVILLENIDRLGNAGEIVSVKDGYARNFLIPNKKAKAATAGNAKMVELLKKKQALLEAKRLDEAKAIADKISGLSITIPAQAGEEDKLFGSITADIIARSLENEGIKVDKKDVLLDEPIKKLGSYQVAVKVLTDVRGNLRVWVVKE